LTLTPIHEPEDPRIAVFKAVRDRDIAGRQGGFIIEGEVVLRTAIRSGRHAVRSLLLAEKRVKALEDLVPGLPPGAEVFTASQAVMDAIVGFPIHRGVLAYGERRSAPSASELLAQVQGGLVVCLFGIGNHDNMGGLFRNAAAFGADAVLLDQGCCDPLYRKAIRVSVGAALTTPFARFGEGEDPIATLMAAGFEPLALTPAGKTPLWALEKPPRAALMLGAEGPGLAPDLLARCRTVSIPMASGFDSLNVAVTSGIALHQLVFGGRG
jgi:tRNA G18 (ribose-2'-O)-methylase SpoU